MGFFPEPFESKLQTWYLTCKYLNVHLLRIRTFKLKFEKEHLLTLYQFIHFLSLFTPSFPFFLYKLFNRIFCMSLSVFTHFPLILNTQCSIYSVARLFVQATHYHDIAGYGRLLSIWCVDNSFFLKYFESKILLLSYLSFSTVSLPLLTPEYVCLGLCLLVCDSWGDLIYILVLGHLWSGPHYFFSWLLSQSLNFLLLTFSSFIAVILLKLKCMITLLLCLAFLAESPLSLE